MEINMKNLQMVQNNQYRRHRQKNKRTLSDYYVWIFKKVVITSFNNTKSEIINLMSDPQFRENVEGFYDAGLKIEVDAHLEE